MQAKEKIRFAATLACSLICAVCTFFIAEAAICEFMMMPSQTTVSFYGFLLLWSMMLEIVLLIFGIGTICAGALGAFFAQSFGKHPKTWLRRMMKAIFFADMALIVLNAFSLVILLF